LHERCPLTFSGLLNGLEGVAAADGQVFILTTNFLEKLDSALIRTGRVDIKYEFPKVTADTAMEMFLQFYPNEADFAAQFKNTLNQILSEKDLCMADLQQHFITHRKSGPDVASQQSKMRKEITGDVLKLITEKLTQEEKEEEDLEPTNAPNKLTYFLCATLLVVGSLFAATLVGKSKKS